MIRGHVVLALLLSVLPSPLFAQFEMSLGGGIHIDRAPEHDRVVTDRGAAMYAEEGEASALRARLGYWRTPTFGLQVDVSRSSNASWSGSTPLPPPPFANRTTYVSARAVAGTLPIKRLQFTVAAGPALMIYGGTGTNLRSRGADVGGVLEASDRLRLVRALGFELAVSNYLYGSSYRVDPVQHGGQAGTARTVVRHDLLLLPGLVYTWR